MLGLCRCEIIGVEACTEQEGVFYWETQLLRLASCGVYLRNWSMKMMLAIYGKCSPITNCFYRRAIKTNGIGDL